jgi:hypothetical protein
MGYELTTSDSVSFPIAGVHINVVEPEYLCGRDPLHIEIQTFVQMIFSLQVLCCFVSVTAAAPLGLYVFSLLRFLLKCDRGTESAFTAQ